MAFSRSEINWVTSTDASNRPGTHQTAVELSVAVRKWFSRNFDTASEFMNKYLVPQIPFGQACCQLPESLLRQLASCISCCGETSGPRSAHWLTRVRTFDHNHSRNEKSPSWQSAQLGLSSFHGSCWADNTANGRSELRGSGWFHFHFLASSTRMPTRS